MSIFMQSLSLNCQHCGLVKVIASNDESMSLSIDVCCCARSDNSESTRNDEIVGEVDSCLMSITGNPEDHHKTEIERDIFRTGVALSSDETVKRFGGANAEFIKGYRGTDNETGRTFSKGLLGIANSKVHEDYADANIKQQAGFSAEVAATSRDNAEAIINGSKVRTTRSDDLPQYGQNHNVVDRVQILNGEIIDGTQAQMKFVGDRNQLFERIAREDGKFSRYRGVKLELPSEQFEDAEIYCRQKAHALRCQAEVVQNNGKPEIASKLQREAENYDQLADNVRDSGLTTEQAIRYRTHPEIETALDITRTSHSAGVEGAKYGATIGGCISLLQNLFAAAQGQKSLESAAQAVAADTAKAGAMGYSTAFAGAAIKGVMQQSSQQTLRSLANTSAPTLAVNICLSLSSSIRRYVTGEMSEAQLLAEVGEKGAGMLSSGMMAAVGQLAIPVPFVGAAIGGMIGYTLSSVFYQCALDAATGVDASREALARIRAIQIAARVQIGEQRDALEVFARHEIPQLQQETLRFFSLAESCDNGDSETLVQAVNHYATLLGKELQFRSIDEFEYFMHIDQSLRL